MHVHADCVQAEAWRWYAIRLCNNVPKPRQQQPEIYGQRGERSAAVPEE